MKKALKFIGLAILGILAFPFVCILALVVCAPAIILEFYNYMFFERN